MMKVASPAAVVVLLACSCASTGRELPAARLALTAPELVSVPAAPPRPLEIGTVETPAPPALDAIESLETSDEVLAHLSLAQEVKPEFPHHLIIHLGQRTMEDDDDWDPIEDQPAFGVTYVNSSSQAVDIEASLIFSRDEDDFVVPGFGSFDAEVDTVELSAGVRKSFGAKLVRPYVGAGLSIFSVDAEIRQGAASVSDDDTALGLYAHGGVHFLLTDEFFVGADLRYLWAEDVDFRGVDFESNSYVFTLLFGFNF